MNVFVRRTAAGFAAAATLTLAACSSGTTTGSTTTSAASAAASTSSPVGMSAGAMPSAMSSAMPGMSSTHNDADVTFAQMMIVHHQGAIEMADLAPTRAASSQVKDLAAQIKAAQGPEIEQMTSWLQTWGVDAGTDMNGMPNTSAASTDAGGMGGMDHGGMSGDDTSSSAVMGSQMPGMKSADEMSQLTAATGADFDKMFLQMMMIHHQGAVEMADTEIADGSNPDALALAESIKTSQTQEITTMQQLLQTL